MIFQRQELSECELTTMKCVWDAEHPITCQEVMEQLEGKYGLVYKDTTVYTFLKNLKTKGFVESERKGVTYYRAIRSEEEFRNAQLLKAEKFWFQGSSPALIATLVKTKKMNKEQLNEIKRLIDELDS